MESQTPLLRVRNLTHAFGHLLACDDISFELPSGEVLGVVGESGSRKTNLLNCLSARRPPTKGLVNYLLPASARPHTHPLSDPAPRPPPPTASGVVLQHPPHALSPRARA